MAGFTVSNGTIIQAEDLTKQEEAELHETVLALREIEKEEGE